MNNFEYITKDMDNFIKFSTENELSLSCDICEKLGFECSAGCVNNFISYLKLEKEFLKNGEIDEVEWKKYMKTLNETLSAIGSPYLDINWLINHLKGWVDDGHKLSNTQKQIILNLEKSYENKLNQIKRLQQVFDLIKNNITKL